MGAQLLDLGTQLMHEKDRVIRLQEKLLEEHENKRKKAEEEIAQRTGCDQEEERQRIMKQMEQIQAQLEAQKKENEDYKAQLLEAIREIRQLQEQRKAMQDQMELDRATSEQDAARPSSGSKPEGPGESRPVAQEDDAEVARLDQLLEEYDLSAERDKIKELGINKASDLSYIHPNMIKKDFKGSPVAKEKLARLLARLSSSPSEEEDVVMVKVSHVNGKDR